MEYVGFIRLAVFVAPFAGVALTLYLCTETYNAFQQARVHSARARFIEDVRCTFIEEDVRNPEAFVKSVVSAAERSREGTPYRQTKRFIRLSEPVVTSLSSPPKDPTRPLRE